MTQDQRSRGPKLRVTHRPRASDAGDRHDPGRSQAYDHALVCRPRRDARPRAGAADVLLGDPNRPLPFAVWEHLGFADRTHLTVRTLSAVSLGLLGVGGHA